MRRIIVIGQQRLIVLPMLKAISTGEPVRKYKDRVRCNWKTAVYLDLAGGDCLDGYEFDDVDDEMLDGDI